MAVNRVFKHLLQSRWDRGCNVCIGLDVEPSMLPSGIANVHDFNVEIIKTTAPYACAYKPNAAFYESNGTAGWEDLKKLTEYAHGSFPEIPIILDAKRGDNGNSNKGYVKSIFDSLNFDAVTVHSYMGVEPLKPFLDRGDKGIIALTRTSNPGAGELQDLDVSFTAEQMDDLANGPCGSTDGIIAYSNGGTDRTVLIPLHQVIAMKIANHWNVNSNMAVVAGATYPNELNAVRRIVRDMPILIPGVGAQGGSLESAVANGKNLKGDGMIISASRSIASASSRGDFAEAAAAEACRMNSVIQSLRAQAAP